MFITPYFGGCKYTNNFLFINKNIVFQHFVLLITYEFRSPEHHRRSILPRHQSPVIHSHPLPDRLLPLLEAPQEISSAIMAKNFSA